jgi:hypothetical protein
MDKKPFILDSCSRIEQFYGLCYDLDIEIKVRNRRPNRWGITVWITSRAYRLKMLLTF